MPERSAEFNSFSQNGSESNPDFDRIFRGQFFEQLGTASAAISKKRGVLAWTATGETEKTDHESAEEAKKPDYVYFDPNEEAKPPINEKLSGPLRRESDTVAQAELANITAAESSIEKKRNAVMEKLKGKEGFAVKKLLIGAVAAATVLLASSALIFNVGSDEKKDSQPTPAETKPSITEKTDTPTTESRGEVKGAIGIKDGYNEYGMFANKGEGCYEFNFADASRVAEVCDNDPKEMVKYTIENQVETLADYIPHLPDELKPDSYKGLTILEVEEKLEGLSDEEFDAMLEYCKECFDKAKVRYTYVEGKRQNALMMPDDNATYDKLTHEDIKLIRRSFYENNEITEFYWEDDDGNEIGSIPVKATPIYEEYKENNGTNNGEDVSYYSVDDLLGDSTTSTTYSSVNKVIVGFSGCMQVIGDPDSPVYEDVPEDPTPTPTPPAAWGKEGNNAYGGETTSSDLTNPYSEVSEEQNNGTNNGDQGYVDDYGATPGSPSTTNGTDDAGYASSGIIATDANTDDGRLQGGESQGGPDMAGENAYQDANGKGDTDAAEDNAQAEAQEDVEPGGDNYSDEDEEGLVAGGDF